MNPLLAADPGNLPSLAPVPNGVPAALQVPPPPRHREEGLSTWPRGMVEPRWSKSTSLLLDPSSLENNSNNNTAPALEAAAAPEMDEIKAARRQGVEEGSIVAERNARK